MSDQNPPCPQCGEPTRLVHAVPRIGGLPEIRGYKCDGCGHGFAVVIENGTLPPLHLPNKRFLAA